MNEARRMAELYRSVYEGDGNGEAWHGPALRRLLKDVTPEQASCDPKIEATRFFSSYCISRTGRRLR